MLITYFLLVYKFQIPGSQHGKSLLDPPKVEVSMGGCIVVPTVSPQSRGQVMQAGLPVPAYEASLVSSVNLKNFFYYYNFKFYILLSCFNYSIGKIITIFLRILHIHYSIIFKKRSQSTFLNKILPLFNIC